MPTIRIRRKGLFRSCPCTSCHRRRQPQSRARRLKYHEHERPACVRTSGVPPRRHYPTYQRLTHNSSSTALQSDASSRSTPSASRPGPLSIPPLLRSMNLLAPILPDSRAGPRSLCPPSGVLPQRASMLYHGSRTRSNCSLPSAVTRWKTAEVLRFSACLPGCRPTRHLAPPGGNHAFKFRSMWGRGRHRRATPESLIQVGLQERFVVEGPRAAGGLRQSSVPKRGHQVVHRIRDDAARQNQRASQ